MNVQKVDYKSINCPRDFSASLRETGFSVLHNHPIDIALIEKVYSEWVKFFESDFKHDYLFSEDGQDGYFPFKTENAKGAPQKDLKEFFHVYDWGKFPKELSIATLDLQSQMITLTSTLLNWIQVETPDEVTELFSVPLPKMIENSKTNLLRVIHYPPLDGSEEEGAIRGAAHEDINLITLLVAGTQPGLQVRDVEGGWHDVSCDPGCIAVNTGDMLQMASNGYYPSTTHQIINPGDTIKNESRYSMPLFLHPEDGVKLSNQYTARQYLEERLKEIGLKN